MAETKQTTQSQLPVQQENKPAARRDPGFSMDIDLVEYLFHLIASWWLILGTALVFAVVGHFYITKKVTPMYKATSTIYVVGTGTGVSISNLQLSTYMMKDYIKVFDLWEVSAEVKQNLDLPHSYSALRSMISVKNDDSTRMIDITASTPDAQFSADLANEYANVVRYYIADNMRTDLPSIMSYALVPTNPYNINTISTVIKFALAGVALSAAFVFLRMILDDKIKTAEDVMRYSGMINLAVVPVEETLRKQHIETKKRRKARKRRGKKQ